MWLTLKKKNPFIVPTKRVYSGLAENRNWDKQTMTNNRQICRTEGLAFMEERGKLGGAISKSSGWWGLLIG